MDASSDLARKSCSLHNAAMRRGSLQALRHSHSSIKAVPGPRSLTPLTSHLLLCALTENLHPTAMSCYNLCRPCGPTPLANSCNEPCVRQCQDSQVVIQPSTVVVTLPGPILSSFPQNTAVGSSASAAVGSALDAQGVSISSGGFGFGGLGCFNGGRARYPC
ncbi:feather keratin 1-like [Lagopus muta]|uniref:feather keratin 1-like n=2 Tax=Lagopus muta TaxID=64668 RepID=UPI0020A00DB4|nr:feather keratin 1-like [Lagopus muta]